MSVNYFGPPDYAEPNPEPMLHAVLGRYYLLKAEVLMWRTVAVIVVLVLLLWWSLA